MLSGILGAASYAGFYRSLQLGPVSLVSPVFSAYAAITVLLAVVVGQESLAAAAAAGIAATLGGVILASAAGVLVFRERLRRIQIVGIGLTIAGLLVLGLAR